MAPQSKEAIAKLRLEYLEIRNRAQAAKAYLAEVQASRQRGELLDKKWVKDSLQYIGACFRQRSLRAPSIIARQLVRLGFVAEADEHAVSQALLEEIRGLLHRAGPFSREGDGSGLAQEARAPGAGSRGEGTPENAGRSPARASARRAPAAKRKLRRSAGSARRASPAIKSARQGHFAWRREHRPEFWRRSRKRPSARF